MSGELARANSAGLLHIGVRTVAHHVAGIYQTQATKSQERYKQIHEASVQTKSGDMVSLAASATHKTFLNLMLLIGTT